MDFFPESKVILPLFNDDFSDDGELISKDLDLKKKRVCILFFTPWCPHCHHFKKVFAETAEKMYRDKFVVFASFDCSTNGIKKSLIFGVRGFPTVLLFENGILFSVFRGDRTITSLTDFVKNAK